MAGQRPIICLAYSRPERKQEVTPAIGPAARRRASQEVTPFFAYPPQIKKDDLHIQRQCCEGSA